MTNERMIELIADEYGYEPQSRQLIEEMAELTQAINKLWREDNYGTSCVALVKCHNNLVEEIADVQIVIWQLKHLLGLPEGDFNKKIEDKLKRQIDRIGRGNSATNGDRN